MKINDVMKKTNLTKKAIQYYCDQGLISPKTLENNYRDFSKHEVDLLKTISSYRKLGLSLIEIKEIFKNQTNLKTIVYKKSLQLKHEQQKYLLLLKLSEGVALTDLQLEINQIDIQTSIIHRLLDMFPGYYGRMVSIQFAGYLNESIETEGQKQAFDEIIAFLDSSPTLTITKDLEEYLEEITNTISDKDLKQVAEDKVKNIENYDNFINENKEILETYRQYKNSEEYQNSKANQLMIALKDFNTTSGFYDIFIPALRRLSPTYNQYYETLLEANQKFINDYPNLIQ